MDNKILTDKLFENMIETWGYVDGSPASVWVAEGMAKGKAEGKAEGRAEGEAKGEAKIDEGIANMIRAEFPWEQITSILNVPLERVQRIADSISENK